MKYFSAFPKVVDSCVDANSVRFFGLFVCVVFLRREDQKSHLKFDIKAAVYQSRSSETKIHGQFQFTPNLQVEFTQQIYIGVDGVITVPSWRTVCCYEANLTLEVEVSGP